MSQRHPSLPNMLSLGQKIIEENGGNKGKGAFFKITTSITHAWPAQTAHSYLLINGHQTEAISTP